MDHIMNNRLSLEFGQSHVRIPLEDAPHILNADALEVDWADLLPPEGLLVRVRQSAVRRGEISERAATCPGAPYRGLRQERRNTRLCNRLVHRGRKIRPKRIGADRLRRHQFNHARRAGGATLAAPLRTLQLGDRLRAPNVCLGLGRAWQGPRARRHYRGSTSGTVSGRTNACSAIPTSTASRRKPGTRRSPPYLFDAGGLADPHLTVKEESGPINGLPKLVTGTQPLEDGNLTFSTEEMEAFIIEEQESRELFRPFPGAREFIRGEQRWILHTADVPLSKLKSFPRVQERLKRVREFRGKSKRKTTKRLEHYPSHYGVTVIPEEAFLIIPQVSSERRDYVPIAWMEPPVIPSEKLRVLLGATKPIFGLLISSMHMAWMRAVTGRMKSDYMYSVGVVYNTFPMPPEKPNLLKLEPLAQAILDARAAHQDATLADLYDPDLMPPDLRKVHQALDRVVDKLYRRKQFCLRAREGRAPVHALRENERTPKSRDEGEIDAAKTENRLRWCPFRKFGWSSR